MPRITLDLHAAMDLAKTPEWVDLGRRFGELDLGDKLNQPALISMVRELVADRAGPACRDLLHLVDDSGPA
ncbi:hypothetical protein [Prescottella equi]|uniref:hypothetical protein n=1 Tax=Rhodococcus hoagii TaxID=43767 RepID=UPI00119F7F99|nr:hypothetical protein [Prescottella equi]